MSDLETQRNDLRKSKEVIRDFLNKEYSGKSLDEQLSDFRNFDFMELLKVYAGDILKQFFAKKSLDGDLEAHLEELKSVRFNFIKEFCTAEKITANNYFNCDDTELARSVFFVLWHDAEYNPYALPGLNSFSDIGARRKYGGETINTYNTLFGTKNQGIEKFFSDADDELKAEIKKFRKKYLTIGNFMLLPSGYYKSLNIYKNKAFRDFADLFFEPLWNKENAGFLKWKEEKGQYEAYFTEISTKESFCKVNFLERYFADDYANVRENLFKHPNPNMPYRWFYTRKTEKENYRAFAMNYIKIASSIIDDRAERICAVLRERLG